MYMYVYVYIYVYVYTYVYTYVYMYCKSPVVEPTAVVSAVPKPKVVEITQPGKCPKIISKDDVTTNLCRHLQKTTTALINFSSLLSPAGSAPAALASLLFDPPEPQIIGKTQ